MKQGRSKRVCPCVYDVYHVCHRERDGLDKITRKEGLLLKRTMKKMMTSLLVMVIVAGMVMELGAVHRGPWLIEVKAADTTGYSNAKKSWYFKRNTEHQPSSGADSNEKLNGYRAYYYDSRTKEKVMYLTFDCGYENGYTAKLLDILKKHDVKALFFVTKHFVKSQPALCKRMKEEGHLVGNHTMNHVDLPTKSVSQIQNEVKGLEEIFQQETGYELDKYLRPPMGEYSDRVLKIVKDMGYTTVFWSMAYYDYDPAKQPGKQYVIDHFKKYYHKGAIALMHNISRSNAEALDEVLKFLKKQGYQCMRMDAYGKTPNVKVTKPQWEEYLFCDGRTSPDYIELKFFADGTNKQKPDGYKIYRKEKGGSYQLIATKKAAKDSGCRYVDRDVTAGKTYYYKVKSYRELYGKTYVSEATESMKKAAVNRKGSYTVTLLEQDAENPDTIVVKLHANANNAVSKFTPEVYTDLLCLSDGKNETELMLCGYSTDAVKWIALSPNTKRMATLKPSQDIYLKFQANEPLMEIETEHTDQTYTIKYLSLRYQGFYYTADLNLTKQTATAKIAGEYYH